MDETPSPPPSASSSVPLLSLAPLLQAIGDPVRWQILGLLAAGQPLMVKEVAAAIGRSQTSAAKHLAVLRRAGITRIGRGRLQGILPHFVADATARVLDFGYLQLRLGVEQP